MIQTKEKEKTAFETLKGAFGYKNRLAAPRLVKAVVSVGTGKMSRTDKKRNDFVAGRLAKITGQKPAPRVAKKSIATFKVRQGESVGFLVTLRGVRMYSFLDKLLNVALPRTKDFRGLKSSAIDEMGNCTFGIREHAVFPETSDEELKDIFGFAITVVTTAKDKKEAEAFLRHLGFPFEK